MLLFLCNLSDVSWLSTLIFFFLFSLPPPTPQQPFSLLRCTRPFTVVGFYTQIDRSSQAGRPFLLIIRPPSVLRNQFWYLCSHVEGLNTKKRLKKKCGRESMSLYPGPDTIILGATGVSWNCFSLKILKYMLCTIHPYRLYCNYVGVRVGVINLFHLFVCMDVNWISSFQDNIRKKNTQRVLRTVLTFRVEDHACHESLTCFRLKGPKVYLLVSPSKVFFQCKGVGIVQKQNDETEGKRQAVANPGGPSPGKMGSRRRQAKFVGHTGRDAVCA